MPGPAARGQCGVTTDPTPLCKEEGCPVSQMRSLGLREALAQNWGGPNQDSYGLSLRAAV